MARNRQGDFIWYELMARDSEALPSFYQQVMGWTMVEQKANGESYPTFAVGDDYIGGLLNLSDEMAAQGARPTWLGYVGVDDVDDSARKVEELGGKLLMPPRDIPGVGRFAMVTDPQQIPFYIMRGAVEGRSTAFSPDAVGRCSWNELTTPDQDGAITFYAALLHWENRESMAMSDTAEYKLLHLGDVMIGGVSPCTDEQSRPGWTFYFRVPNIYQAIEKIKRNGGELLFDPHAVPGDDYIVIAKDPEGVIFGLAGKS